MHGKRNVYVADALFIHHESKSRGYNDTLEKQLVAESEQLKFARLYQGLINADPFYTPNLSFSEPYKLSFESRRRALWDEII
jgi:hypothetical protein